MNVKIEVLILFDKEDRELFLELKKHLAPLEMQGLISVWDEDQIIGGTDRKQAIDHHLQKAWLVLLLVSAHFMASYEYYTFAKQALAMHTPPEGYVVPVLLREVDWEHSDFGQLAPLPGNRKPISSWTNRHAAYVDVVKGIRAIIEAHKQSLAHRPSSQSLSSTHNSQEKDEDMSDAAKDQRTSFDVFLCHNSKDKDEVKKVARQLQKHGIHPWLDEWELPPGLLWQPLVEEQIKTIRSAAVFVSKNDMGPWQKQETYALLNQFVQRGCPVIPVLLDTAPGKPDLPPFLAGMTWVDFRKQEPDPLKRLIWGITGQKPENHVDDHSIEAVNMLHLTITTPDGNKYITDVPADTLVDRLLRDFLSQWPMVGSAGSMHFSLRREDAASLALDPSSTLREVGLAAESNLTLVSEALGPNDAVSLTIEDNRGGHYVTTMLLNTAVGQLANAFLRTRSGTGEAVVEWILSSTQIKQLRLGESLYNQGVCDDALLRIYAVEE
jgi:hypothetical protein